jgi:DNA processing protein
LYVRGELTEIDQLAVAVVGTRTATTYGKAMATQIAGDLAAQGITVVSGLAQGIDTTAHQAALRAGGRTFAILPCGIDKWYPPENRALAEQIATSGQGALITEYPLGEPPTRFNFPPRNRIISGLSLGVVVVEAAAKSGALLTAEHALRQGREVFAVPGNASSPASEGANGLLREGARLVTSAKDVLHEVIRDPGLQVLRPKKTARPQPKPTMPAPNSPDVAATDPQPPRYTPENDVEAHILGVLAGAAWHLDEIVVASGLSVAQVSAALTLLELKGAVGQRGPLVYALAET